MAGSRRTPKAPPVATEGAPPLGPKGKTGRPNKRTLRIRMYRVGFGDCFLVSFPLTNGVLAKEAHAHVLVDCGVHAKGDIGTLGKVVDDVAKVTNKKLELVVVTHAHQDHIAGFDRFADKFKAFDIGAVWLPWTWNPNDPQAAGLQKKHQALTARLAQDLQAAVADPNAVNAIENLKGNEHAIELLKSGFEGKAKVWYLKAGQAPTGPEEISIPDLSVKILGPPQSEEFLAQMDPPASEHYLRLGPDQQTSGALQPFMKKWRLEQPPDELIRSIFTEQDKKLLQEVATSPLNELAFALDQVRNNESLVVLFIFRGQYLLFPGDAQCGNWRWWLENLQPDSILPEITFFKVAHHGSVNATPKDALEKMSDGKFASMVSTQSEPWTSIPRVPLMARISTKSKSKIVRSDWVKINDAPKPLAGTAPAMPSTLPNGFSKGDFWFDYLIQV
ncbi:MAG: MBL fold metallo-hydrolase [Nitrososphaerales archaeon]|nr:MBL fold metallo-hydrolase [Nitrososphaerales archaeon]